MDSYTDTESNSVNWFQFEKYWPSTVGGDSNQRHLFRFDHSHSEDNKYKTESYWVRAVRSF